MTHDAAPIWQHGSSTQPTEGLYGLSASPTLHLS